MDPGEFALAVIEVVVADAEVEIEDVDGEDLLDVLVIVPDGDVFCDGLGSAVKDALEEVEVVGLLYLDEYDLTEAVLGLDVDAVELVVFEALVAFALEEFCNGDLFSEYG